MARTTRLYHLYFDLTGVQHLRQKEWHDIYGEVVRVAPDELSYNSARAWFDICGMSRLKVTFTKDWLPRWCLRYLFGTCQTKFMIGHRSRDRPGSFEKDSGFFGGTERFNGTHIVIANDEDHRRLRRLQSHAFSEKALTAQQDVLKTHLDLFIEQLRKRALLESIDSTENDKKGDGADHDGIVDIVKWLNFLTFDTIGDLAFGSPFGSLVDGVTTRYVDVIFSLVKFGNWYRAARRFPSPLRELMVIAMIPKNLVKDQQFQHRVSRLKVEERMKRGTERADFSEWRHTLHFI